MQAGSTESQIIIIIKRTHNLKHLKFYDIYYSSLTKQAIGTNNSLPKENKPELVGKNSNFLSNMGDSAMKTPDTIKKGILL